MKLTTDRHDASRGLFAIAELLVAPGHDEQSKQLPNRSTIAIKAKGGHVEFRLD